MVRLASSLPIAKIQNAAIAGAIVVLLVWVLRTYAGVELPAEVQSAVTLLISLVVGYLTPIDVSEIAAVQE